MTEQNSELPWAAAAYRRSGFEYVRRYHRLEVDARQTDYDGPVLFVANHGFGGIFDLNVFASRSLCPGD